MKRCKILKVFCTNYFRTGYAKENISEQKFLENIIEYNDKGQPVKEVSYLSENEINIEIYNEYDDKGQLIANTQIDAEETLIQKTEFEYDDQNHIEFQHLYYSKDMPPVSSHLIYENDKLVRQEVIEGDKIINLELEKIYNKRGLLEKEIQYDEDNNPQYITLNEYDEDNLLVKQVKEDIIQKDRRTFVYYYDEKRNPIEELIYNYDNKLLVTNTYAYDENNNIIEKSNSETSQKLIYQYAGDKIRKIETYNLDGKKLSWTDYDYDDVGEYLSVKHYAVDEIDENSYRIIMSYKYERDY